MSEKADEVGMGKIFHAAILALNRQDEDSKVPTKPTLRGATWQIFGDQWNKIVSPQKIGGNIVFSGLRFFFGGG